MKSKSTIPYHEMLTNPASAFSSPEAVLESDVLTPEQKIKVLRQWEYDARELEVAEEENMGGGPPDLLSQILSALVLLGRHPELNQGFSKQGGGADG
jgi:hypothetical protein